MTTILHTETRARTGAFTSAAALTSVPDGALAGGSALTGAAVRTGARGSAATAHAHHPVTTRQFTTYVRARGPALLRTARSLTPNPSDAEDLLQTALAATFVAWERITDHRAVDGYVRRTLVNTRTSQWRKRRIDEFSTGDLPEPRGPEAAQPDAAEQQAQRDAVLRAISRLPARQRAMVVLRYYEDMSEAQTAEALGVSVGTVKSAVSRALGKLREDPELREQGSRELVDVP
jgi:RNA polymerase sigma-70 factor (sigma-E family)